MSLHQASLTNMRAPYSGDRRNTDCLREAQSLREVSQGTAELSRVDAAAREAPKRLLKAPTDCRTCKARPDGLCEGRTAEEMRVVAGYKWGDRQFRAGEELFGLGEPCDSVYNLVEGWMFLYNLLEDGRRQILHFALPGAVLGFHPARGAKMTYGVQALTDAAVCVIPRRALEPLSKQLPEIGMRLAWLIARDHSLAFDHLTSVGRRSARERVAHLLLELFIRSRAQWPGSRIQDMQLPLTQEHIGDATGLTLVHVNRVLRDLRQEGVVQFQYRRLRILDPDKLIDIAGIDPQLAMSWMLHRPSE